MFTVTETTLAKDPKPQWPSVVRTSRPVYLFTGSNGMTFGIYTDNKSGVVKIAPGVIYGGTDQKT